jgi:hypothetical protein
MTDNTNLEAMITNLGVKVDQETRIKLAKLTFSEYSQELQNADTAIGKLHIDNNLKLELLKLQVHYLHNLDAVQNAEKDKKDATEELEQKHQALIKQYSDTQRSLEAVNKQTHEQNETLAKQLSDTKNSLDVVNKENQSLAQKQAYKLNALRLAEAKLADKEKQLANVKTHCDTLQANIQTKLHAMTHIEGADPHMSNQSQQKIQRNPSVVKLPDVIKLPNAGGVKLEKVEVVNLSQEESKAIAGLKSKLVESNILKFTDFADMFAIMYKHRNMIKKFLITNHKYALTNNDLDKHSVYSYNFLEDETYIIHIPNTDGTYLNINIGNTSANKHAIAVYNMSNSEQRLLITIKPTTESNTESQIAKERISANNNAKLYATAYADIKKLLDILFPKATATQNKYLKYKNKYLQLKKLYNL